MEHGPVDIVSFSMKSVDFPYFFVINLLPEGKSHKIPFNQHFPMVFGFPMVYHFGYGRFHRHVPRSVTLADPPCGAPVKNSNSCLGVQLVKVLW